MLWILHPNLKFLCLKLHDLLVAGSWHPQKDGPDHWHLCWPSPSQQIHRISPGQCAAAEGVPLQTHPVPQEGFCSQEGRQHCKFFFVFFSCCHMEYNNFQIDHSTRDLSFRELEPLALTGVFFFCVWTVNCQKFLLTLCTTLLIKVNALWLLHLQWKNWHSKHHFVGLVVSFY